MNSKAFLFSIAEFLMVDMSITNIYRTIAQVKDIYLQVPELSANAEQHAIDTVKIVMRTLEKI